MDPLSVEVTVCDVESLFVHVTLVPALTVSVCGVKAKFWIATVVPVPGAAATAPRTPTAPSTS